MPKNENSIPRDIFRFVEKCLYEYKANSVKLDVLTEDLKVLRLTGDVHIQNYDNPRNPSSHSDPVLSFVEKVELLESKIKKLERVVNPITKMVVDLRNSKRDNSKNAELLYILEYFYFDGYFSTDVRDAIGMSVSNFYRKRCKLVRLASSYLGMQ